MGIRKKRTLPQDATNTGIGNNSPQETLNKFLTEAAPLIEQVNALYRQYLVGVADHPPKEKRRRLELIIDEIQKNAKGPQLTLFKVKSLIANYLVHREKWDRQLKDLESGKIKRQKKI